MMFTKHFVFNVECATRTLMAFLFICVRLTETGECRKPNFLDVFVNLCFVNEDLVKDSSLHGSDRVLASSFRDWKFAPRQFLHETFPIDPIMSNYVREVRNVLFSEVRPTPFKTKLRLVAVSEDSLVNILNMDPSITKLPHFVDFVGGSYLHGDAIPLAHRYGGHQFGSWAGQLGDGRAVMLGEFINSRGERWELQLKGSGLTPYSRRGDGRAVLRSSVREFLCSEAMHYLGIPTSRATALVVSDDSVIRDQFYNGNIIKERGAIVLRIAKSWFRIGSLELLAYHNEINLLKKLVDFVIQNYFPSIDNHDESKYLQFYSAIVSETALLIAKWQSVGFTHGVCNTDNFSLLSITIDYGPFGFLDSYDPRFVPNTSDDEGMYSYERQPDVGAFNLDKLRLALIPLLNDEQKALSITIHKGYADIYKREFMAIFRQKLGLFDSEEDDEQLVAVLLKMMEETRSDFTMTFRQLGEISISDLENNSVRKSHWALMDLQKHDWFSSWVRMYARRITSSNRSEIERQTLMNSVNPRYILRNWIAQNAISQAEGNNFDEVKKVLKILQNPFQQQPLAESSGFADRPPSWSKSLKVSCSS